MKNKNTIRITRTAAAAAAAIMMTALLTGVNAFAVNTNETFLPKTAQVFTAVAKTPGEQLDEAARKLNQAILNGAIDTAAMAIPGGKIIGEPLKLLVGAIYQTDEGPDPVEVLAEQEQAHFEELCRMIKSLDDDLGKYTEMLTKKIDTAAGKQTLGEVFRDLSTNLCDLVDRMKGIVYAEEYTSQQKLLLMADINNGSNRSENYLVNVRQACDAISKTLSSSRDALTVDFFDTMIELSKPGSMFYLDAHDKARLSAEPLIQEYFFANYLLTVCQDAYRMIDITPEQAEEICTDKDLSAAYERCTAGYDRLFQMQKLTQTFERMADCIESCGRFEKLRETSLRRIIKNGTVDDYLSTTIPNCTVSSASFKAHQNTWNYFKTDIAEFADHIRTTGAGKVTFREYMRRYGFDMIDLGKQYIVIDAKVTDTRGEKNGTVEEIHFYKDNYWTAHIQMYNYTSTIKVIDADDPELKVIDLPVKTYRADSENGRQRDIKEISNKYFFFVRSDPTAEIDIKGPK